MCLKNLPTMVLGIEAVNESQEVAGAGERDESSVAVGMRQVKLDEPAEHTEEKVRR
jgi:hypothetical protein